MGTNLELAKSNDGRDVLSDWTSTAGAELATPGLQSFKREDVAPGLPDVMLCAAMAEDKPEIAKADQPKVVDRKAAPDNLFDRIDQAVKSLPAIAMRVAPEAGELSVVDLGKFLKSTSESVTAEQAEVLNKLTGMKVNGDQLSIACDYKGSLKSLVPDSKDLPDGMQLSIKNPTMKISADPKTGEICLSDIKGLTAFHKDFPFLPVNVLDKVIASKKVDKDGNATCELKLVLPKIPGMPREIVKSIPLTKESAQLFDAALAQVSSGKDMSKIIELMPALLSGDAANTLVPLLSKIDGASCANDRVQILFKEEKQPIGNLPLVAGKEVRFESKSENGGYTFDKIHGVHLELPVPKELLSKLGTGPDAPISRVAISKADANGDRTVRVDFEHGNLKSVTFAVDKQGAPRLINDKLVVDVQVGVNDKAFDCQLKLPIGNADKGISLSLSGDATARTEILKKLGVPDELAPIGERVTDVSLNGKRLDIVLDKAATLSIKGLDLSFDRNVSLNVETVDNKALGAKGVSIDISGVQVSGFNFTGSRWKEIGSKALNGALSLQNDLPMRIDRLSLVTTNDNLSIGVSSNQGMLRHGQFLVSKGDNPEFISGELQVKHPLRNLDPINLLRNRQPELTVKLDQQGVVNPVDTGINLIKPVVEAMPAYKAAKFVVKAVDDPVGETKKVVNETVQDLRDVRDATKDAARFTGRNLKKAWNWIVD